MFEALRKLLTGWFGPAAETKAHTPAAENAKILRSTAKMDEIHPEISETTPSHAVPYDETLLERARTQWQFGDWESLANIHRDTLQHHPDRAKLALLAAAGRLQTDNPNEAKQFIRLAQDWGISKKLISQILIAGVHNSLGRAEASIGRKNESLKHFEEAIKIGASKSDIALLTQARFTEQIRQLTPGSQKKITKENNEKKPIAETIAGDLFDTLDCKNIKIPTETAISIQSRQAIAKEIDYGGNKFKFFHRPDSIGDQGVIKQIFEEKQYEFSWLPQGKLIYKIYEDRKLQGKKSIVVDAGANIGASCIWFHLKFPSSVVLAIEPDKDNCELLGFNNAGRNAQIFHGGITDTKKTLYLNDPGESDWGFRVGETGSIVVNCIGPEQLMNYFKHFDYLPLIFKFDIEGSEEDVFKGDCAWLESVPMLIIELHDWLFPGENKSRNFINAMARHDFDMVTRGENIFCFNRKILSKI